MVRGKQSSGVDDEDTASITIVIDQVIPVGSAVKREASSSTSLKW